jgi:hypothetical protein
VLLECGLTLALVQKGRRPGTEAPRRGIRREPGDGAPRQVEHTTSQGSLIRQAKHSKSVHASRRIYRIRTKPEPSPKAFSSPAERSESSTGQRASGLILWARLTAWIWQWTYAPVLILSVLSEKRYGQSHWSLA